MGGGVFRSALDAWCARAPFYCQFPPRHVEGLSKLDRLVAVAPDHSWAYVRIPKAANSAVTATLERETFRVGHVKSLSSRRARRRFLRPSQLDRRAAEALGGSGFIFTVVRNPYHRILSAYLDKFCEGRRSPRHYRRRYGPSIRRFDSAGALSFQAFCRWLEEAGGWAVNGHWLPQTRIIEGIGFGRLDAVGRVENLDADLAAITARLRAGGEAPQIAAEVGPVQTGASSRCAMYYDAETRAIVRRLYARDFELLGYAPDD